MPDVGNTDRSELREFFDTDRAAEIAAQWPLLVSAWGVLTGKPLPGQVPFRRPGPGVTDSIGLPNAITPMPPEPQSAAQTIQSSPDEADRQPLPRPAESAAGESLEALFGRLRQT